MTDRVRHALRCPQCGAPVLLSQQSAAALTVDGDGNITIFEDPTRVIGVRCMNPDGGHTLTVWEAPIDHDVTLDAIRDAVLLAATVTDPDVA